MDQETIKARAAELQALTDKMEEQFKSGDLKSAGQNIPPFFETLTYSLTNAASISIASTNDFQTDAVSSLYTGKWITDDENSKLHKLRIIRNVFEHQTETDITGDAEKKKELKKYRDDFPQIIKWCRSDTELFVKIADRVISGTHVENSSESKETKSAEAVIPQETVHSVLMNMRSNYYSDNKEEAYSDFDKLFQMILSDLTENAALETSNDKLTAIDNLYHYGWITEEEQDDLHTLRTMRNVFAHKRKIELSGSYEEKKELERYCNDFDEILGWLDTVVESYDEAMNSDGSRRKKHISAYVPSSAPHYSGMTTSSSGHRNSHPTESRIYVTKKYAPLEAIKQFRLYIPLGIAFVLSVLFGIIFDSDNSVSSPPLSSVALEIYLAIIVMYAFLYKITAHFFCGAFIFMVSHRATDSIICALLLTIAMILMVTRFTDKIRNFISNVFYGFGILFFIFTAPQFFKSKIGKVLGIISPVITSVLPIALFILIFLVINAMIKQGIFSRPFTKAVSDETNASIKPTLSIAVVSGIVIFVLLVFNKTWKSSITADLKDSPDGFYTIAAIMLAVIFYIVSMNQIKKRYN